MSTPDPTVDQHRAYSGPWRDDAACLGHDPEMWTGDDFARNPYSGLVIAEALAICREQCPVRAECLADALERREKFTIRGGYTPEQRDRMRRNRGRTRPSRAKETA